MQPRANRRSLWAAVVAGVLLAGLVVLSVVSAMGTEGEGDGTSTTTRVPDQTTVTTAVDGFEVTDTTVAGWLDPSGDYDGAAGGGGDEGIAVTDNTVPVSGPEQTTDPAAQSDPTSTTVTTVPQLSVTTTTLDMSVPRRVHHPTWDHRLPSTWEGLPATECAKSFRIEMLYDVPSWDYKLQMEGVYSGGGLLIDAALRDPTFEVEPGRSGFDKMVATIRKLNPYLLDVNPDLLSYDHYDEAYEYHRQKLADMGVSSVQDIREIGEAAINVRWYASRTKFYIMTFGHPNHPLCAPMIEAANKILTPYTTTTTTAAP